MRDDDISLQRFLALPADPKQLVERDQRQQAIAQPQEGSAIDAFYLRLAARRGAHQFDDADLRDGKSLRRAFDNQRRDDRKGQRNLDRDRRALAECALQIDRAADLLDIGADDIHADAATGHARHLSGGREAGLEDVLIDLLIRHLRDLGLGRETVLQHLLLDIDRIEPFAVIADLDQDVAALVIGVKDDGAGFGLADAGAISRPLNTMIGRVADHVGERILDQLHHLAIKLGIGALHLQVDLLTKFK